MAASRKLQGEIDRCLKKVSEGVEQFEDIWKKVHNASNSNQKEKYEADLKKEIKKLQRLRDQIKSWMASGEIKDKSQLLDNRRLIEKQMERFKVVERETKTKAYSKEGLGAAQNKDPAQRERDDMNRWLSESIYTLNLQVDQFESEIESLLAATKKKKIDKDKSDRVDGLRDRLERHRFHIKKLEILMRMLNNESIDCGQIKSKVKDEIETYIEYSHDPDYIENEGLYDEIDMEDLDYPTPEITVGKHVVGITESTDGSTPSSSVCGSSPAPSPAVANNSNSNNHSNEHNSNNDSSSHSQTSSSNASTTSTSHHERKRANKEDRSGNTPVKPQVVRPSTSSSNNSSSSNALSNSAASSSSSSSSSSTKNTSNIQPLTPTKPVSGSTSQSTPNNSSSSSGLLANHVNSSSQNSTRDVTHSNTNSGAMLIGQSSTGSGSISGSGTHGSSGNQTQQQNQSNMSQFSVNGPLLGGLQMNTNHAAVTNIHLNTSLSATAAQSQVMSNNSVSSATASAISSANVHHMPGSVMNSSEPAVSLKAMAQKKLNEVSTPNTSSGHELNVAHFASGVGRLVTSLSGNNVTVPPSAGVVPPGSIQGGGGTGQRGGGVADKMSGGTGEMVEARIPEYLGVAPLGKVPITAEHELQFSQLQAAYQHMPHPADSEKYRTHFPREPCQTPSYYPQAPLTNWNTVEFFQKLATETLFFIFYYMEGTEAQYLAAKALKKQSWRFHTQYMMWFQRHEDPRTITEEFERGTYIFFDYENWGQGKKENFTFEYRFLEDKDLN